MQAEFWRDRNVFLTGHTGFKGGWLSLWLQRLGASVTGYSLPPPTSPSLFEEARVADGMRSLEGDVRDGERLAAALDDCRAEVVLHLAAQAIVRTGYEQPLETYSTNVMGTGQLLEAVRRCPSVRAVVVVTSDKCYHNDGRRAPYAEDDPMGGHDPYSSSKGCAELLTASYRSSYFTAAGGAQRPVAVATARAGNVIGGGDWAEHRLVTDLVRALAAGRPAIIRSPAAVRPWQHVLNPLAGYLRLAERLCEEGERLAEGWNFGPPEGDCRPVAWLADRVVELWGGGASWQRAGEASFQEAAYLTLDSGKARRRLGWSPLVDLDTAVDWLVDWYRQRAAGADLRRLTLERIARAEELAAG